MPRSAPTSEPPSSRSVGARAVWRGAPEPLPPTRTEKGIALLCGLLALVALGFAVVLERGFEQPAFAVFALSALLLLAGFFSLQLRAWLRGSLSFELTAQHVVVRRGPLVRLMARDSLSYARIRWHASEPDIGDLELVRAVPTGALRRTLSLRLPAVKHPDRVLALLRGVPLTLSMGRSSLPLPQRLDDGERVLWTAQPRAARWDRRRRHAAVLATALVFLFVRALWALRGSWAAAYASFDRVAFVAFVASMGLAWALVLGAGLYLGYLASIEPRQRAAQTRYFVTNRRVLIRAGNEELSLDRQRIAGVVEGPRGRRTDLFLLIDGPAGRALATHGAFGGEFEGRELAPVFSSLGRSELPEPLLPAPPSERAA